jgi:hypothetical protein
MAFGYITLLVAFLLSAVAAYYSVLGLTAIFSAAFWPIVLMGSSLEVAKIITAMWLHKNWHRCSILYKFYLLPSLFFLMLLTSMGTFGFLSRAHSDQGQVTAGAQEQLSIFDERIKTEKENADAARRALTQLDQAVEQIIARSTTEESAVRASNLRRTQQRERQQLQRDIANAQSNIIKLNQERAPYAAAYRKIEAEVGPVKYVAALIYGDNPSSDLLERAVRWVIILIVLVFDPLAVVLVLAGIKQLYWAKTDTIESIESIESNNTVNNNQEIITANIDISEEMPSNNAVVSSTHLDQFNLNSYPYLFKNTTHRVPNSIGTKPPVATPVVNKSVETASEENAEDNSYKKISDDYFEIKDKMLHRRVVKELYPKIYKIIEDAENQDLPSIKASFGTVFPKKPERGEMFLQVSTLPSKLYKFNGNGWIQVDKNLADSYTYNTEYLQYLVDQMGKGILTPDDLTVREQEQVAEYLKNGR